MKKIDDRKRSDREFAVGDFLYVKLQPYRQHLLKWFRNQKSSPRYFGTFPMEAGVVNVAYKLTLPATVCIHSSFHVSQLKKHVGTAVTFSLLPVTHADGPSLRNQFRFWIDGWSRKGMLLLLKFM